MVQTTIGQLAVEQAGLSGAVLKWAASGMDEAAISAAIESEYHATIKPDAIRHFIELRLGDSQTQAMMALHRKREAAKRPRDDAKLEDDLSRGVESFISYMEDVRREYTDSQATVPMEIRKLLGEMGARATEAQYRELLSLARRMSLDRAIQNAAAASREARGWLELTLKKRGLIQAAPTVNVLALGDATQDMLSKLCEKDAARIAGLPEPATCRCMALDIGGKAAKGDAGDGGGDP